MAQVVEMDRGSDLTFITGLGFLSGVALRNLWQRRVAGQGELDCGLAAQRAPHRP